MTETIDPKSVSVDKSPTWGQIDPLPKIPPSNDLSEAQSPDGVEAARMKRKDGLILAEGYSYYYCTRNCGNGRFISGKTYPLKDDPAPIATCFRKI